MPIRRKLPPTPGEIPICQNEYFDRKREILINEAVSSTFPFSELPHSTTLRTSTNASLIIAIRPDYAVQVLQWQPPHHYQMHTTIHIQQRTVVDALPTENANLLWLLCSDATKQTFVEEISLTNKEIVNTVPICGKTAAEGNAFLLSCGFLFILIGSEVMRYAHYELGDRITDYATLPFFPRREFSFCVGKWLFLADRTQWVLLSASKIGLPSPSGFFSHPINAVTLVKPHNGTIRICFENGILAGYSISDTGLSLLGSSQMQTFFYHPVWLAATEKMSWIGNGQFVSFVEHDSHRCIREISLERPLCQEAILVPEANLLLTTSKNVQSDSVWLLQAMEPPKSQREERITIGVITWNVGAVELAESTSKLQVVFKRVLRQVKESQILIISLQEIVDLGCAKGTAKEYFQCKVNGDVLFGEVGKEWCELLSLLADSSYELMGSEQLVGILLVVFKKVTCQTTKKCSITFTTHKTGFNGKYGNKGAVLAWLSIEELGKSICIIAVHLPSGVGNVRERNIDANIILKTAVFPNQIDRPMDADLTFFFGDTNYRLEPAINRSLAEDILLAGSSLKELQDHDELQNQQETNSSLLLKMFEEHPVHFRPTYKYDRVLGSYLDSSKKQRIPAWTDRILWCSKENVSVECKIYDSDAGDGCSDHHLVIGSFEICTT